MKSRARLRPLLEGCWVSLLEKGAPAKRGSRVFSTASLGPPWACRPTGGESTDDEFVHQPPGFSTQGSDDWTMLQSMPTHRAEHDAPCCWTPCSGERGPHHGGRQAPAAEATQRLSLAPGMRHRGRAAGRAAEGLRLRLWVGCGYHQTQTFTWPWPPLRLQTVRAELVSRPIPARMAKAQWQVFDSSKDETHCSSPGPPQSTSFHGGV